MLLIAAAVSISGCTSSDAVPNETANVSTKEYSQYGSSFTMPSNWQIMLVQPSSKRVNLEIMGFSSDKNTNITSVTVSIFSDPQKVLGSTPQEALNNTVNNLTDKDNITSKTDKTVQFNDTTAYLKVLNYNNNNKGIVVVFQRNNTNYIMGFKSSNENFADIMKQFNIILYSFQFQPS